jgi:hypothetical protein
MSYTKISKYLPLLLDKGKNRVNFKKDSAFLHIMNRNVLLVTLGATVACDNDGPGFLNPDPVDTAAYEVCSADSPEMPDTQIYHKAGKLTETGIYLGNLVLETVEDSELVPTTTTFTIDGQSYNHLGFTNEQAQSGLLTDVAAYQNGDVTVLTQCFLASEHTECIQATIDAENSTESNYQIEDVATTLWTQWSQDGYKCAVFDPTVAYAVAEDAGELGEEVMGGAPTSAYIEQGSDICYITTADGECHQTESPLLADAIKDVEDHMRIIGLEETFYNLE